MHVNRLDTFQLSLLTLLIIKQPLWKRRVRLKNGNLTLILEDCKLVYCNNRELLN